MAFITLRQSNVVSSPDATIKNFPLLDSEVDNNFANLNVAISNLANLISASTGNITFTGNFIPSASNVFDIGSPSSVFKDLWLSGNSLHLGQLTLSVVSGNIALNGTQVLSPTSAILGDNVVTTNKIIDSAITESKIASSAVTDSKIAVGSVTEQKIGSSAVTDSKIATNAVTEAKINASAVTETKIASDAVTESKIASNAVTVNKIGSAAVTEAKIDANAVTTTKIADNSITELKIVAGAVTETKIGSAAVTEAKIGSAAVSSSKLSSNLSFAGTTNFPTTSLDQANIIASAVGSTVTFNLYDKGVIYYTGTSTTNANITVNFTAQDTVNVGNITSFVLVVTNDVSNRPRVASAQVNGTPTTIRFLGDTAPVGQANIDLYSFNVIKTGVSSYTILSSKQNYN